MTATRHKRPSGRSGAPGLRRTTDDRVVWGVAGGLAEAAAVDAILMRVAFVALTAIWGLGIGLYLVGALAMPERDWPTSNPVRPGMRPMLGQGIAVGVLCAGLVATARALGLTPPDDILVPWMLVVVGVGLVWGRMPLRPRARLALPPGPAHRGDPVSSQGSATQAPPRSKPVDPVGEPRRAQTPTEPQSPGRRPAPERPSGPKNIPLGTLTAGTLLVASGLLYLLERGDLVDVSWRLLGSIGVVTMGLALIAGGWWGRPRGLVPFGSVLCALLLAATIVQVPLTGGVGRRFVVVDAQEVQLGPQEIGLGAGTVTIDLTEVDPLDVEAAEFGWAASVEGPVVHVVAELGAGQMRVVVRPDQAIVVDARVGLGRYDLVGVSDGGVAAERIAAFEPVDDLGPPLVLDLDVGVGSITVEVER